MEKRRHFIGNISRTKVVDIDSIVCAHFNEFSDFNDAYLITVTCTNGRSVELASYSIKSVDDETRQKIEAFARDQFSDLLTLLSLTDEELDKRYRDGDNIILCLTPEELCEDIKNYEPKPINHRTLK